MLEKGYTTHVPLICIRDKSNGHERLIGTNNHDELIIDNVSGAIRYHNLQNNCGTPDEYEFTGQEEETYYGKELYVKMVPWREAVKLFESLDANRAEADKLIEDMAKYFLDKAGGKDG